MPVTEPIPIGIRRRSKQTDRLKMWPFLARLECPRLHARRNRGPEKVAGDRCLDVGGFDALARGPQCHAELVDTSTNAGGREVVIIGRLRTLKCIMYIFKYLT